LETVDQSSATTGTEAERTATKVHPVWEFLLVLAAIAGLVGWCAPRLLRAVSDSRLAAFGDFVSELRGGVSRYQADVGTLLALDRSGVPFAVPPASCTSDWSFAWVLSRSVPPSARGGWERYQGPYIKARRLAAPPLGDAATVLSGIAGTGSRLAPAPPSFDLTGAGMPTVQTGHAVVWLSVTGVSRRDFETIDARMDWGGGYGFEQRRRQGAILWSPENGGTLLVHLLHN
jgi:hypothetical protein